MPNTEQSFADRLGRGQLLQSTIDGFVPAFAPADTDINAANFLLFLESLDAANDGVAEAAAAFEVEGATRRLLFTGLQDTGLRVKDHVTGNAKWKASHKAVSRAADKVRGQPLPKAKTPPPAPGTPVKKAGKGSRTQQGFADLDSLFYKLIQAVKKVTGYTADVGSGLEITVLEAQLQTYHDQLDTSNDSEAALESSAGEREELYDDPDAGLNAKMKSIKKAVGSQYTRNSTQYKDAAAVKV